MSKLLSYFQESYDELMEKVTWPSRESLLNTSVLVVVSSLLIGLVIYLGDIAINAFLQNIFYR